MIHSIPMPSCNFNLSSVYQSQSVSPSSSFFAPSISIHSSNNQLYESFQFKDQVTLKKTKLRNLHKSSEDVGRLKRKQKQRKLIWSEQMYQQEKQQKIKVLESLMAYIDEIRNIKENRNNELIMNWKNSRLRLQESRRKEEGEAYKRRSMQSVETEPKQAAELRSSIDEKIVKEKRMMDEMRRRIYQINVQEFRKYYRKEQQFNPKNKKLLNLPDDLEKAVEPTCREKKQQKQEVILRMRQEKELKDKIRRDCDRKFEQEHAQFSRLLKMRFTHETQFNWKNM